VIDGQQANSIREHLKVKPVREPQASNTADAFFDFRTTEWPGSRNVDGLHNGVNHRTVEAGP
jgi:hypothetical protein